MNARLAVDSEFRPPSDTPAFDPTRIAAMVPANGALKGLFLEDALGQVSDRAEVLRRAGAEGMRIHAFSDVPYLTYLRVIAEVARMKHPSLPAGAAVRQMSRGYYARLRDTMAGKVVFGVLGNDAARVLAQGYRGWSMTLNFGKFSAEVLGPRHIRYRFAEYPRMVLESSDVGVVLGAMDTLGVSGQVLIAPIDDLTAELDLRW